MLPDTNQKKILNDNEAKISEKQPATIKSIKKSFLSSMFTKKKDKSQEEPDASQFGKGGIASRFAALWKKPKKDIAEPKTAVSVQKTSFQNASAPAEETNADKETFHDGDKP